jgi:hypothetical protein
MFLPVFSVPRHEGMLHQHYGISKMLNVWFPSFTISFPAMASLRAEYPWF